MIQSGKGGNAMIKNVIFDFGNVLLEWNEDKIVNNFSNNKEEQEILKEVIFKSDEWSKLDNGSMNYQDAILLFKEKLPINLKNRVEEIMSTWYKKMQINEELCNLIKKLKENNYKIYALSNTHVPVYEYVKNLEIGKYFDGFLISAIENMMKPNEDIYYRLFEKFELVPQECFFIDDSERNIAAGRKCGMEGHIFNIKDFQKLIEELNKNNILV